MNARLRIASSLGAGLIRLLGSTWHFEVHDEDFVADARRRSPNVIFTFWHGRMLVLSYGYRNRAIHVLASRHRDGELMGQIIRRLGFGHVRGSSTRGGTQAILELVAKLREGYDLGITVDGPKGPKYVVKPGPLQIAKMSGCAVVPVTTSARRRWVLSSWDAFELPKPFTRVAVRFGPPVFVPPDATLDQLEQRRLDVERIMNEITKVNDEAVFSH